MVMRAIHRTFLLLMARNGAGEGEVGVDNKTTQGSGRTSWGKGHLAQGGGAVVVVMMTYRVKWGMG